MKSQKFQMVCGAAFAFILSVGLPVTVSAQQGNDPFIENLRERNEVTSQAIENSPLGGLLGMFRGDHLEGSGQRGSAPLFSRGQQQQSQPRRQPSENTRLSLRNPLEGKLRWNSRSQTNAPPPQVTQRVTPRQQPRVQQSRPQPQQRSFAQAAPKEGPFNRLFAGLRQRQESRPTAPTRWSAPKVKKEKSGGLFAFLKKAKNQSDVEGDWSREAQRRTSARAAAPQVELASLNRDPAAASSGGALSRWVKSKPFDSWMAMPREEKQAAPVKRQQPVQVSTRSETANPITTWEKHYVKTDRTGFHAAGKKLNSKRPDLHLSRGTTVQVTNRGWNWSNVVLSDGRMGTIQTSRLSRSAVKATQPRSAAKKKAAPSRVDSQSKPKETKRSESPAKKKAPAVNRSDDPLVELANMDLPRGSKKSARAQEPEEELSRAALDAVLEPSLESLLDPGVAATLRDLEDELLLPLPPELPEDADTGAGLLPPLN